MSRSGYSFDHEDSTVNLWRGAVASAIKGKRGQAFLIETLAALDALPNKRLIAESFQESISGNFCTLGAVGANRGMHLNSIEHFGSERVGKEFGISTAMASEIMFQNDEGGFDKETPEQCWERMHGWIKSQIKETT